MNQQEHPKNYEELLLSLMVEKWRKSPSPNPFVVSTLATQF